MTLTDAAITTDGRFVAVVAGTNDGVDSAANVAHVLDVSTGTSPCLLRPEGRHVNRVYALHDNRRVMNLSVSTTPEQTWQTLLCIWRLPGGELLQSVDLPTALWHLASSSDDSSIAAAGYTGLIVILDGALSVQNILGSDLGVDRLALSDDGRTLIVACHRAETSVPFVGESNADSVRRMKLAMRNDPFWDGVDLYQESGKGDGFGLRIWNVDTGELQHSIDGAHRERISMLQPVAGDATYLSSGWDGNLTLWETGSADPINTITAHDAKIVGLAVSRDGDRAVSVAEDDTLKVWNLRAMHARQGESDHRGPVVTMVLPPDGAHVVTGSHDGALKIWGAEHGDLVRTLAPLQGLNDAACADTARLVCAVNRTIQVVDLAGTDTPVVRGEHEALARSVRVGGNHCVSAGTTARSACGICAAWTPHRSSNAPHAALTSRTIPIRSAFST